MPADNKVSHRIRSAVAACGGAVLLSLPAASLAIHTRPDLCSTNVDAPAGLTLHLDLADGTTIFHEGEIIALAAEYKAGAPKMYTVNNRNYDRSGRLDGDEIFCIAPDAGTDPLFDYFHSAGGFFGGGLSSSADPGDKPFVVNLELNEWLSLPPGSYRLSIIGNRATKYDPTTPMHESTDDAAVRSNEVQFQVVAADPDWQAAQLGAALQSLESTTASDEEKKHAARVLRFLGSEASTRELARRYWSGDHAFGWDMKFGLYGSPHRSIAIEAMKAQLTDPAHPISNEFIDTLVSLEMAADPNYKIPAYDEKHPDDFHRALDAYSAERQRRESAYLALAAATGLPRTGEALARTASEMLLSDAPLTPEARTHWRHLLISSFNTLPVRNRNELIEYRWLQVGGPEWLPVLKSIVTGPPSPPRSLDDPNRGVALRRVWQLSPEDGRALILAEIIHPGGDIGVDVLGLLPEKNLPQIEAPTLARIRNGSGKDVDYALIDRYATARILPDVKAIYEHGDRWVCESQSSMLRYFIRVDPDYGAQQVASAAAARSTGCYQWVFTKLDQWVRVPQVQSVAIASLDDPSARAASDAATALQHYGSPSAEKALWARLEMLHEKYKDHPELLHPQPGMIAYDYDSGLEQALVNAILDGQSWFADESTILRLKDLTSSEMQNSLNAAGPDPQKQFQLVLRWWPEDDMNFTLGWYDGKGLSALKEKLAQFPAGSHFSMVTTKAEREAYAADFAEVEAAIAANGDTLEIESPR